ncbi:hypothetical protein ACJIZ3_013842 [Penstemon smallii]|uniref:Uncharacterized protein n=1 Tax=Penstemon smallii TaxID=265156 RepID=A0ABD3RHT9_9LAMI
MSRLQKIVALSTTEADLCKLQQLVRISLQNLLNEFIMRKISECFLKL